MGKNDDGHFWGMVLAAAAVAITGAVALIRSFRTSRDGGRTWEGPAQGKDKPEPEDARAGDKSQKSS
ncbi:MAG: hypothetical protein MUO31_14100 [Thermodesulfovibrionales bacterium]|nr:hypothetical protein [Thermodesulfovibrionales bacterium]